MQVIQLPKAVEISDADGESREFDVVLCDPIPSPDPVLAAMGGIQMYNLGKVQGHLLPGGIVCHTADDEMSPQEQYATLKGIFMDQKDGDAFDAVAMMEALGMDHLGKKS